jgi:hypothetical protein
VAATVLLPLAAAAQAQTVSLTRVAHDLGYHYAYLGPDEAVALSRPGIVIIIRPGTPLFDVNDRSIPVEGGIPVYRSGDVYVSSAMIAELRALAGPEAAVGHNAVVGMVVSPPHRPTGPVVIDTLSATHIEGDQALHVEGQATPLAAITLTLKERLSSSIPDVIISRMHVSADGVGVFAGRVAIAPAFFSESQLIVVASADSNTTRSVTTLVNEFPNGHTKVKAEEIPRALR